MERTGIEPVTSGLQSVDGDDSGRLTGVFSLAEPWLQTSVDQWYSAITRQSKVLARPRLSAPTPAGNDSSAMVMPSVLLEEAVARVGKIRSSAFGEWWASWSRNRNESRPKSS
jgi:hypothetical protein